jgi:hypothetical protein
MMSASKIDLAQFFGARSRATLSAEEAIKDLNSRNVYNGSGHRLATVRAVCDSAAQRNGRKLSALSAHQLAQILRGTAA